VSHTKTFSSPSAGSSADGSEQLSGCVEHGLPRIGGPRGSAPVRASCNQRLLSPSLKPDVIHILE